MTVSGFAAATIALGGACASGGERDAQTSPTSSPERSFITTPTPTPRSVTATSTPKPTPTWSPEFARVFALLPAVEDMPRGFVLVAQPHSVIAVDIAGERPPNARVQFELADEPDDDSEISCFTFYLVELSDEAEAHHVFESFQGTVVGPSRIEGQAIEAVDPPAVADETAASTLVSAKWTIGSCGTRLVYSYASVLFRSGTIVAWVHGFAPQSRPDPRLAFGMARLLLSRIDEVRAND